MSAVSSISSLCLCLLTYVSLSTHRVTAEKESSELKTELAEMKAEMAGLAAEMAAGESTQMDVMQLLVPFLFIFHLIFLSSFLRFYRSADVRNYRSVS